MLKNHLHSLIHENYPGYHSFFGELSCDTALAFYEAYPFPACLFGTPPEELAALLSETSRNRFGRDKALAILKRVKENQVPPGEYESVRNTTIRSTVLQLKMMVGEMEHNEEEIARFVDLFDYPLTSMKGIDTIMAARLIAEIGDIERFSSAAALASYAGVAPVTYASGATNVQYANKGGNRSLNEIFFRLALEFICLRGSNKVAVNPFFYDYYHQKLADGKTKRQAIKCLERRLVNIVYGIMKHKEDYINPPVSFPERDKLLESKKIRASLR